MFDEKYQECERLYKRRKIGIGMNVVAVIIFFISLSDIFIVIESLLLIFIFKNRL